MWGYGGWWGSRTQAGVPETIALLSDAGIRFWMCTGDKFSTALTISKTCNLKLKTDELVELEGVTESEVRAVLSSAGPTCPLFVVRPPSSILDLSLPPCLPCPCLPASPCRWSESLWQASTQWVFARGGAATHAPPTPSLRVGIPWRSPCATSPACCQSCCCQPGQLCVVGKSPLPTHACAPPSAPCRPQRAPRCGG
jgi:hypothetical protein